MTTRLPTTTALALGGGHFAPTDLSFYAVQRQCFFVIRKLNFIINMTTPIILNSKEIIENVILRELKTIIYSKDTSSAPYIKFTLIANSIEFIGACSDRYPFLENGHSEDRFNEALTKFFNSGYKQFTKSDSQFYMYEKFRCPMIHAFRPSFKIDLTERNRGFSHLQIDKEREKLYLVLEDFYDDIEKAALKLLEAISKGTIANKPKVETPFLHVGSVSGTTTKNSTSF